MKVIILLLFLFLKVSYCQNSLAIDTSYTIKNTYLKLKDKYPKIKIISFETDRRIIKEREIIYKTDGSRKLHLDLYYKKSKYLNPAVILIHGGGWKSGNKSQMQSLAIKIASKGYICFAIEFRLYPEAIYPVAVNDIKDAILFIRKNSLKFNVIASKIAILGCSSGGQLATLVGTTIKDDSSRVQAIINIDGILSFNHPESQEEKSASLWLGGSYQSKPDIWKEASPLTKANRNTPPILFINSDIPRFHAGRTAMIEILNKYQIYNETRTINNAPHSFWFFKPWFKKTVRYSVQFLDTVFKDNLFLTP